MEWKCEVVEYLVLNYISYIKPVHIAPLSNSQHEHRNKLCNEVKNKIMF